MPPVHTVSFHAASTLKLGSARRRFAVAPVLFRKRSGRSMIGSMGDDPGVGHKHDEVLCPQATIVPFTRALQST
jgi:hypothetical protein